MPTPTEYELIRKTQVEWLSERGFSPAACGLYRLTNQQLSSLVGSIDRAINMASAIGRAIESSANDEPDYSGGHFGYSDTPAGARRR